MRARAHIQDARQGLELHTSGAQAEVVATAEDDRNLNQMFINLPASQLRLSAAPISTEPNTNARQRLHLSYRRIHSRDNVTVSTVSGIAMPTQPRGRACQNCQSIKIKCELGARGGEPPCERCMRLNKECTLAAPKRQKDRVAELEAKVEALTKLLGSQGLQDASVEARDLRDSEAQADGAGKHDKTSPSHKKRKLDRSTEETRPRLPNETSDEDKTTISLNWLDELLPIDLQQRLLEEYVASYQPIFPVVPLSVNSTAAVMKETLPHTLNAVIYIASAGILSWDLQDKINLALIEDLTSITLVKCQKSLDLLQALQVVCLWYRSPRNSTQIPLFQLVSITSEMAVDLGFGGTQNPPALSIAGVAAALIDSVDAYRRWLSSFIITETASLLKRRSNEQKWTPHHDYCLHMIEENSHSPENDHLLAQHVRATKLLATISEIMALNAGAVSPILGTPECQSKLYNLQVEIDSWRLGVPFHVWSSSLKFTGFFMEVLLYEFALQTPTNKASFAAPFLIEKLSIVDVPAPAITQGHFEAVRLLKTACHNLLDTASSFTGLEIITLPTMIYGPRIAHTVVVLMKLHIAVTVQGSTYSGILSTEDLQTEAYLDKCIRIIGRGSSIDKEAVMVRIMQYMHKLKEWLHRYESSRLDTKRPLESHPGLHAIPDAKGGNLPNVDLGEHTNTERSSEALYQQQEDQTLHMDAPFTEFISSEFAMDDIGLFELFSEAGGGSNLFDF